MKTYQETVATRKRKPAVERTKDKPQVPYEFRETAELVMRVKGAAKLIAEDGEAAFAQLGKEGSPWRSGDDYVFVIDMDGNMLVHPDPELQGRKQPDLKDINGRHVIQGLMKAATGMPDSQQGWYHYQWPEPGSLIPRWKSSFVRQVAAPSGKHYIVGSGMYNDRMERAFVVDMVTQAVAEIERTGREAFAKFHDPAGPFLAKDAYIFVIDMQGVEWVNPAFPNIEGRNMLDQRDTDGRLFYHDMIRLVQTDGSGWIGYKWPKPGESISTEKSAYVKAAQLDDGIVIVGCGVYLADAPKEEPAADRMTAGDVMSLVREAASLLEKEGEQAYPAFRKKGSKWFHGDTYLFIFDMEGTRILHPAEPASEGRKDMMIRDIVGRPIVRMILDAASGHAGEGWVHYMYPEPGDIFPSWKSGFVKRVKYPSGREHVVGCGIYRMRMEKAFIEDLVDRACLLVERDGWNAFGTLRDRKGPFVFMDTYVFVQTPEGRELVNPLQPTLEGRNLMELRDLTGKAVVRDEIEAAMTRGAAWLDCWWYKPGDNNPSLKHTYVRKVQHGGETFIVGSGLYAQDDSHARTGADRVGRMNWNRMTPEHLNEKLTRVMAHGGKSTISRFTALKGASIGKHAHESEEVICMQSGSVKFIFDDRTELVGASDVVIVPSNKPHAIEVLEDSVFLGFFAPVRNDWRSGQDQYLRKAGGQGS